jgi:hypothetical protein
MISDLCVVLWPSLMLRSSEGVVYDSRFNLAVFYPSDRMGLDMHCIVASKDKMMVYLSHLDDSFIVYIMSSCLLQCSVCYELNISRCMLDSGLWVEY